MRTYTCTDAIERYGQRWFPFRKKQCYYRNREGYLLHRYIWEKEVGPIPAGHNIHHKDGNYQNNDLANLACIPSSDHRRLHMDHLKGSHPEWRTGFPDAAREAAAKWHGSDEGHVFHQWLGKRAAELRPTLECVCEQCGKHYTIKRYSRTRIRFCSNNCKSTARRLSGVDDEDRTCTVCGTGFRVNKYSTVKTCSRACGGRLISLSKRGLQPDG